jgi:hypothetical protein
MMSEEILIGIQISIPEAQHILRLLYHFDASKNVDLIRQFEAAIDDAILEAEEEHEEDDL